MFRDSLTFHFDDHASSSYYMQNLMQFMNISSLNVDYIPNKDQGPLGN